MSDQPVQTSQIDTGDASDKAGTNQQGTEAGKTVTSGVGTQDDIESNPAGTSRGLETNEDKDTKLGDSENLSIKRSPAISSHAGKNIVKAKPEDTKLGSAKIRLILQECPQSLAMLLNTEKSQEARRHQTWNSETRRRTTAGSSRKTETE